MLTASSRYRGGIVFSQALSQLQLKQITRLAWIISILSWICYSANVLEQTTLVNDGVVSGSISVPGEVDEFVFDASAGEAVNIRIVDTGGHEW